MATVSRLTFWLITALAVITPFRAGEGKNDPVKANNPKEAKEKLLASGQLIGRVVGFDRDRQLLTLDVTLRYLVPNVEALARQVELRKQLAEALGIADAAERLDRVREVRNDMIANQAELLSVEEQEVTLTLPTAEDLTTRVLEPPPAFDDKGKYRRYTAKELKELKGPGNLPGYHADPADIQNDQTVRVYLARRAPPKLVKKGEAAPQPFVSMLLILAQPE